MFFSSTTALAVVVLIYKIRSFKMKKLEQKLQSLLEKDQSSRLLMQRLSAAKRANEDLRESLQTTNLLDLKGQQLLEIQQVLGEMNQIPLSTSFEQQFAHELGGKKQLQRSLPSSTKKRGRRR